MGIRERLCLMYVHAMRKLAKWVRNFRKRIGSKGWVCWAVLRSGRVAQLVEHLPGRQYRYMSSPA